MENKSNDEHKTKSVDFLKEGSLRGAYDYLYNHLDMRGNVFWKIIPLFNQFIDNERQNMAGVINSETYNKIKSENRDNLTKIVRLIEIIDWSVDETEEEKSFKEAFKDRKRYLVIKNRKQRTKAIMECLQQLLNSDEIKHDNVTIRASAFLSIIAIEANNSYNDTDHSLYLEEKEILLKLIDKGCSFKCIICPANENHLKRYGVDNALYRTRALLEFLTNDSPILNNIEFAISEFDYRNSYIIYIPDGTKESQAIFEGHKRGQKIGYGLTIYQSDKDIVQSNAEIFDTVFEDFAAHTLCKWGIKKTTCRNKAELLREATIECLRKSISFLEKRNSVKINKARK